MLDEASFQAVAKANAFAVYNGITIHQLELGKAKAELEIGPNSLNPYGRLHGGAYYTLADCAGGTACRTDGRKYVTLDGTMHFVRSVSSGKITATATVQHHGRTTALVDIQVTSEDGTLLATGDFTFFCIGSD